MVSKESKRWSARLLGFASKTGSWTLSIPLYAVHRNLLCHTCLLQALENKLAILTRSAQPMI